MRHIYIASPEELPEAAEKVLKLIGDRNVVALYGVMGAGKTTLIKALCKRLGVTDPVNSPTFTLVNEYRAANDRSIYHFDFYRIKKVEEAYDLGYDEYFDSPGLCLIEWPELIEELLPEDTVRLRIREVESGAREVEVGLP